MSSVLEKLFVIVEFLVEYLVGLFVMMIVVMIYQFVSGVYCILQELICLGFVWQVYVGGDYVLIIKLFVMGLGFMGWVGIIDVLQLVLDQLVVDSGELVCLLVVDDMWLIWVVVVQGVMCGLCYDFGQEQGVIVYLVSMVGGMVWLFSMLDEEVLVLVSVQGLVWVSDNIGLNVLGSIMLLLEWLVQVWVWGYVMVVDGYIVGMVVMVVFVCYYDGLQVLGCLFIVGFVVCMMFVWMQELFFVLYVVV